MSLYLLLAAVAIITCVFFNKISGKLGIPVLLAFILLGMLFGAEGLFKINFDNYAAAQDISSAALLLIIFYGGFGTKWSECRPVAVKSVLLSTLGVVLTAGIVGLFCYGILKITLLEGFLIGAGISSTDFASVYSVLRSKRLNLKYHTASLLEIESGSNDTFAYMLTVVLLSLMNGGGSAGQLAYMFFAQIAYGLLFGAVTAVCAVWVIRKFDFATAGFDAIFVLAVAIFAYAAPACLGGNGYLSVYLVGIILGNSDINNKKSLVHFFDGMTGLMQMLLFFLLGLLSTPSRLLAVALPAFVIFAFLTLVARPAAVFAVLTPFRSPIRQSLRASWAGLRGAASIVFAIMVALAVNRTDSDLFHIVFLMVIFSILIQGSLLPLVARKFDMLDDNADVMKTFTDYVDEAPVRFIEFTIPPGHAWADKYLSAIMLPPDTILVLIQRGAQKIIPGGSTVIRAGDVLVLSAKAPCRFLGTRLYEKTVGEGDAWENRAISEIIKNPGLLIVMVKRGDTVLIPKGDTILKAGDVLVMHRS